MQTRYNDFFEALGMKTAPIEIIDDDGNGHKMEFPIDIDGRPDVMTKLQKDTEDGRAVYLPLTTLKKRAAIILDGVDSTQEPAPDILLQHDDGQTIATWLVSGALRPDARGNLERRFELLTGGRARKSLYIPLYGFNGWTLQRFEIQARTARDFDDVLPVVPKDPEPATDQGGLLPPVRQKIEKAIAARRSTRTGSGAAPTAWDEVKNRTREILPALGLPEAKQRANGEVSYICPCCGHGSNGDGLTIIPIGKTFNAYGRRWVSNGRTIKCFNAACPFKSGSVIDLVAQWKDITAEEALHECADAIGLDIFDDWSKEKTDAANKWLASRRAAKTAPETAVKPLEDKTHVDGAESPETAGKRPAMRGHGKEMIDDLMRRHEMPDYTAYYERCRERLADPVAVAYLEGRGISIETARAAGIGYDPEADPANYPGAGDDVRKMYPEPRIIVPCTPAAYCGRAIRADIDKRYRVVWPSGANVALFRGDLLNSDHKYIFVAEGWADALALAEVGAPAISINSASNASFFLSEVERSGSGAMFVLCLDNDKSGGGALQTISEGLKAAGRKYIVADVCGGAKDPNAALTTGKPAFIKAVADVIERAEQASADDELSDFFARIQGDAYKPHKTGLAWFDDLLDGGLIPQTLTIIMATPGSGKTALCQQLAEKMAENENAVLYINLEMSNDQMLARAVSMKLAERAEGVSDCMTALQVLQGYKWTEAQRSAVKDVLSAYRANNFRYIRYGVAGNEIESIIAYLDETGKTYQAAGKKAPAVVLDYLHLITGASKADASEIIKQAVAALKMYAIKYKTLAIAISAINRNSYNRITLSSGRDSSGIEYTGDTVISLDYQAIDEGGSVTNEEMSKLQADPLRKMRLRVLKSRHCAPGRKQDLNYAAAYNLFYDPYDHFTAPKFAADIECSDMAPAYHRQKHGKR